jgi:hypothetical protein
MPLPTTHAPRAPAKRVYLDNTQFHVTQHSTCPAQHVLLSFSQPYQERQHVQSALRVPLDTMRQHRVRLHPTGYVLCVDLPVQVATMSLCHVLPPQTEYVRVAAASLAPAHNIWGPRVMEQPTTFVGIVELCVKPTTTKAHHALRPLTEYVENA